MVKSENNFIRNLQIRTFITLYNYVIKNKLYTSLTDDFIYLKYNKKCIRNNRYICDCTSSFYFSAVCKFSEFS